VLTLPTGLLFLGQWHNTCEVTNSTARRIQEPNFCHDNYKNLANMRQTHQGAVGLCQKRLTLQWNNCAFFKLWLSFKLWVDKGNLTSWTVFLIFSLSCLLFYVTIRSYVSLWYNYSRTLKFIICGPDRKMCIYIENSLFSQYFWDVIHNSVHSWWCDIEYCVQKYTAVL
jgi:hypothetical protein